MVTILSRPRLLVVILVASFLAQDVSSFATTSHHRGDGAFKLSSPQHQMMILSSRSPRVFLAAFSSSDDKDQEDQQQKQTTATSNTSTRRSILQKVIISTSAIIFLPSVLLTSTTTSSIANAALGTLPEFQDTNAILQGVTIDVSDQSQYEDTIKFFTNAFDGMTVLRERGGEGGGVVKDTVSTDEV
jgi:hypothetical protein